MKVTSRFVDQDTNYVLLERTFEGDPLPNKGELVSFPHDETYEIMQKGWSFEGNSAFLLYILKRRIFD